MLSGIYHTIYDRLVNVFDLKNREIYQHEHTTAIVSDPYYLKHIPGKSHPEHPVRCTVIDQAIQSIASKRLMKIEPRKAIDEEILLCHDARYLEIVKENFECLRKTPPQHHAVNRYGVFWQGIEACSKKPYSINGGKTFFLSTGDVDICPESLEVARLAVGGALKTVDAVFEGKVNNAFCVVRPPGHHACKDRGMGFCIFNNTAIAARYAQKKYNIKRVLIVDWDVHHGNGTQNIFEEDPSVFYFSTHHRFLYPGTGREEETGKGNILNCPIMPRLKNPREEIFKAFDNKLLKSMEHFKPELVIISCGFDAHKNDPLGGFNLTDQDYVELTQRVMHIADKYAQGRLVSVLEGGYNVEVLGPIAKIHVETLLG